MGQIEHGRNAPLAIDLFCGLGGWTSGLLAVEGLVIERVEKPEAEWPPTMLDECRVVSRADGGAE